MLQYKTIPSGKLQCCGTLIWDSNTLHAVLIDPTDDASPFLSFIEKQGLQVKALLLTHGHVDHAASICQVAHKLGLTPQMHPDDLPIYERIPQHGALYGIHVAPMDITPQPLHHGQILSIGPEFEIEVLHVPGHTPGCVTFYIKDMHLAIVGDTLFYESVGRTDLPGGSTEALIQSIRQVLYKLPPETVAIPGHGPATTIGHEMKWNSFVTL